MSEFVSLGNKDNWVYGKIPFEYDIDKNKQTTVTFAIINNFNGDVRYFTNAVTSKAAFDELTIHKATFATLSKNFTGRNQADMYTHLVKNHIKKVA